MPSQQILVTGVAGFIGSKVASRFLDEGFSVIGVDDFSNGTLANVPSGVDLIEADLASSGTLAELRPYDFTAILHLAGQSSGEISFDDPVADLKKNTVTTLNLIRHALEFPVSRFVYASSMSVYGNTPSIATNEITQCQPLSCYGASKLAAENYLKIYGSRIPTVVFRMFNVYGPGQDLANLRQGMVSIYLAQALKSGVIKVRGGLERYRDFIFVDDVVESWYRAVVNENFIGKTLNLGTGSKTTVNDLLNYICELVPGSSYLVEDSTPGDQNGIYADNTELLKVIPDFDFTSLETGLVSFLNWSKNELAN